MAAKKTAKKDADPLALAMRWAVALAAPIHENNHLPLDTLGGYRRYGTVGDADAISTIADHADISSPSEARTKLLQYLDAGIAAAYAKAKSWQGTLPREARAMGFRSPNAFEVQMRTLVRDRAGAGDAQDNPVALDLARFVYYVGLASRAAFLSEQEAWAFVARAAAIARRSYGSWAEYARGLSFGRWLADGSLSADVLAEERRVSALLARASGPWQTLPWDLDLAPLDALARPSEAARHSPLKAIRVRVVVHCPECLFPCLLKTTSGGTCPECGASLEVAGAHAWATATGLGEQREIDPEVEDRQGSAVWRLRSLGDDLELVAHSKLGPTCACGSAITDDAIRDGVGRGAVLCACGRAHAVAEAPPAIRAADWRARYVLGGPLLVGEPEGWITLLFTRAG